VSRYQKGETNLDFTEARDSEWQWHQLGRMQVCTSIQTDNHASTPPLSFLIGRTPFLLPNQQCQSIGGINNDLIKTDKRLKVSKTASTSTNVIAVTQNMIIRVKLVRTDRLSQGNPDFTILNKEHAVRTVALNTMHRQTFNAPHTHTDTHTHTPV